MGWIEKRHNYWIAVNDPKKRIYLNNRGIAYITGVTWQSVAGWKIMIKNISGQTPKEVIFK